MWVCCVEDCRVLPTAPDPRPRRLLFVVDQAGEGIDIAQTAYQLGLPNEVGASQFLIPAIPCPLVLLAKLADGCIQFIV